MAIVNWQKEQVFVLFWESYDSRGIAAIAKKRETLEPLWRQYRFNRDLLRDIAHIPSPRDVWVNEDIDEAIEVWDVQE